MKVGAIQMVSSTDPASNLKQALELITHAAHEGCELVVLPEYFCLLGRRDTDKLAIAETFGKGYLQEALAAAARQRQIWIVAGTLPLQAAAPDRVFNACLVFNPEGQPVARYDKIHLFAFDNGKERYDEATVLEAGQAVRTFTLNSMDGFSWRIGLSVCYDLRFPELYRSLSADILLVPSAFTHTTGQAHWEILLRARAIESQAFVVAPAQGGHHENGRRTWGHTMIVDSWGEVLSQRSEGAGLVCAELQWAAMQEHRRQLPALSHRRLK
jgi:deaminated glutathione amidase